MSSSDSEEDSFLNIAQKLSAMKNNYNGDDCSINDSIPLESITSTSPSKNKRTKNKSPAKVKRKKSTDSNSSGSIDLETFRSAFPPINEPQPKRNTRSAAKRKSISTSAQNSPNLIDIQTALPKRRKSKANNASTSEMAGNTSAASAAVTTPPDTNRGKGRGRGRSRGRGRRNTNTSRSRCTTNQSILDVLQAMIPIYSVGNTDEYPDQSDNQTLFSNKTTNDVVEIEDLDETLEENEEMSVKVEWMSARIFKFDIRKYQKITPIFEHFSKQENVSYDNLYFSYNGRILKQDDTPDSIDYSIAKFIDGGIVSQSVTQLVLNNVSEDKDGIKLKFQCQNIKKPFEMFVKPDDKLASAMLRCAEHYEKPLEKLRFEFDGDIISGKSTPKDLDLDGGGCIDVKILT